MKSARVRRTGDDTDGAKPTIPVTNTLRAGIKTLIRKHAGNKVAVDTYNKGVQSCLSFDEIEAQIQNKTGNKVTFLTPRNAPYFRLIPSDCAIPGAAESIMDEYGEDKGDSNGRQLYRLPVELVMDDVDTSFPEYFVAWKGTGRFRWSWPDPENDGELMCMKYEDVVGQKGNRWAPTAATVDRQCDPDECPIYACGDCKHNASLYFVVCRHEYGIFQLTFSSKNSARGIFEQMELVKNMHGQIRGTLAPIKDEAGNNRPLWWLTKEEAEVHRMENGKIKKVKQWLIRLTPDMQGMAMYKSLTNDKLDKLSGPESVKQIEAHIEKEVIEHNEPKVDKESELTQIRGLRIWVSQTMKTFNPPWSAEDLASWLDRSGFVNEDMSNLNSLQEIKKDLENLKANAPEREETKARTTNRPEPKEDQIEVTKTTEIKTEDPPISNPGDFIDEKTGEIVEEDLPF